MKQASKIVASLLFAAVCLSTVAQSKCWQTLCHPAHECRQPEGRSEISVRRMLCPSARECREPAKALCSSALLFANRVSPQGIAEHPAEEDCHCTCNDSKPLHHRDRTSFHLKKRHPQPDGLSCWAKVSPAILFDLVRGRSPIPPTFSADPVLAALRTVVLLI